MHENLSNCCSIHCKVVQNMKIKPQWIFPKVVRGMLDRIASPACWFWKEAVKLQLPIQTGNVVVLLDAAVVLWRNCHGMTLYSLHHRKQQKWSQMSSWSHWGRDSFHAWQERRQKNHYSLLLWIVESILTTLVPFCFGTLSRDIIHQCQTSMSSIAVKPHTDSVFLHFSKRNTKSLTVQYLHTFITQCHVMSSIDKSANTGTKAKNSFFREFTLASNTTDW